MVVRKELSVNKTLSLPLSQVNRINDLAIESGADFSSTTSNLIKLGFLYQQVMREQEENAEMEEAKRHAAALQAGKVSS